MLPQVKEATAELASIPDEAKKHWTVALVQLAMKEAQGEDPEKGLRVRLYNIDSKI
jgi:hypothetical protein